MTANVLTKSDGINGAIGTSHQPVCRRPFYLMSQGRPLFAWLHDAAPQISSRHGIVICPPLHHEQIHSHRALRHLADSLAESGLLVCRFDYDGTGDSAGTDTDPDRVATWLSNIRDAVASLRDQHGCRQVSVIGVRLGALLAVTALANQEINDLILWAPVINGRQYVRELQALSLTGESQSPQDEEGHGFEAAGFTVTQPTADELSALVATQSQPRCQRILIVARDDFAEDRRLVDHFSRLGIAVEQVCRPGYAEMMAEPHRTEVPREAIDTIVNWTTPELPDDHPDDTPGGRQRVLCTEIGLPHESIREQVLTIDGLPALFGILAEPALQRTPDDKPLIVLLNAGASYRVGPHRLNVQLSRELAAQGFRCLRLDLAGLGDSASDDRDLENDPYSATMFRDIDHVLQHANTQLGQRRVVLIGLCSGAYAAFQSAAQFANPTLVESLLINPLTFFWKEGMSIQSPEARELKSRHYYMHAALRPGNWWRLMTGRTQIGLSGAVAMLTGHFRRRTRPDKAASAGSRQPRHDGETRHPEHDDLPGDLQRAGGAGRNLAFFFSASDPGYPILRLRAWRVLKALRRSGKVTCEFFEHADHTFSRRKDRQSIIEAIARHLSSRYKSAGASATLRWPEA